MAEKKRKRGLGPFPCPYPECGKVFSRSDHLARHKANHSSNRFKCEWPNCGRLFTRIDVKKKHEGRHTNNGDKFSNRNICLYTSNEGNKGDPVDRPLRDFTKGTTSEKRHLDISYLDSGLENSTGVEDEPHKIAISREISKTDMGESQNISQSLIQGSPVDVLNTLNTEKNTANTSDIFKDPIKGQIKPHKTQDAGRSSEHQALDCGRTVQNENTEAPRLTTTISESLCPPQSIHWLLGDYMATSPPEGRSSNQTENGAFHAYHDDPLGPSTLAMLEVLFALTPEFPNANCQTEVGEELLFRMVQYVPALEGHPDFNISKIQWFLEVYWLLYHCQYPILHRPSFSTVDSQPLLLLSMIMMGASFSKKTATPDYITLVDPDGLADIIADPLRWLLFASEQAKPPCKSWVIQSLIILETYEITSTSRSLHERACIHNGAKVQLLRRSPILGGDPLKAVGSDVSHSNSLWNTWIESESMKRVALMSFYIDTIHAVVYGHPVNLFANQIKLSLPCPDDLWEYNNVDRNEAPMSVAQTPLFCDALRKLLQKETIDVGPFGKQILLAGLINLLLQVEQNISQWSNFGWDSIQKGWRDTISSAIEFWKTQLPGGSCCITSSSVYQCDSATSMHTALPPSLRPEDTRCSFPVYHAAQIYLRITHYDYIVYAGAPRRMNVPILPEDYEVVVKRIGKWAKSPFGPLCVINSLIFLCEILLSPEDSMEKAIYFYEPDKDPFIYRPNIVISAVLSLWAYGFYSHGPESLFRSPKSNFQMNDECIPCMEDALAYLSRIRSSFLALTCKSFSSLNEMKAEEYSETIKEYYQVFSNIKNINYSVGLLSLLKNGYKKCKWHVGREYAKLLDNCISRSLGSERIFCDDMYDVTK